MMIRAFIALEIPESTLDNLLSIRDEIIPNHFDYKWEAKNKLHITLKFLGDVEAKKILDISDGLERVVSCYNSFSLSFNQFGMFRANGSPRIFWVDLKRNLQLDKIAKEIDILCSNFGFELEKRKFNPHLTLMRIKNQEIIKYLQKLIDYKLHEIDFKSNTITLFQSVLEKSGSIYKPIKSFHTK